MRTVYTSVILSFFLLFLGVPSVFSKNKADMEIVAPDDESQAKEVVSKVKETKKSKEQNVKKEAVQEEPAEEIPTAVTAKSVSGEISGITKDYIAVVVSSDPAAGVEDEILLPIDQATQLQQVNSVSELKVGDKVDVSYDESTKEESDGQKMVTKPLKQKLKTIKFRQKAAPEKVVVDPTDTQ